MDEQEKELKDSQKDKDTKGMAEDEETKSKFQGFVPPTRNYFAMPNEWTDITAEIESLAELKVVEYVLRHTWGFHEFGICKTISVDEFMHGRRRVDGSRIDKGTKLSEQSVRNGIAKAITDGFLTCEVDYSDPARIKKSYTLKMQPEEGVQTLDPPDSRGLNLIPGGSKSLTPGVQTLDPRGTNFRPRSEKETKERNLRKTLKERKKEPQQFSSEKEVLPSFLLSPDEQSVFDLYCEIETQPKITKESKDHCKKLSPHVTTLEEMKSIHKFTRDRITGPNKQVHLGNMVKNINPWLETVKKKMVVSPPKAQSGLTPEQQIKLDEYLMKLGKKDTPHA